VKNTFSRQC